MNSEKYVMGVDPGKNGGFVMVPLDPAGKQIFIPVPMKELEVQTDKLISSLKEHAPNVVACVMEDVHSIFGASAKSNFQFGWINGLMETCLTAAGIKFTKMQPKAWQKLAWKCVEVVKVPSVKSSTPGEGRVKTDTKATSLTAARKLFPGETFLATSRSKVPHDGWVDGALIGWVCRESYLAQTGAGIGVKSS